MNLPSTSATTTYHRVAVQGVSIFYREAGPKDAEIHLLDAGHFALEEKVDEIARLMLAFFQKHRAGAG
jgi:hypothetical protein